MPRKLNSAHRGVCTRIILMHHVFAQACRRHAVYNCVKRKLKRVLPLRWYLSLITLCHGITKAVSAVWIRNKKTRKKSTERLYTMGTCNMFERKHFNAQTWLSIQVIFCLLRTNRLLNLSKNQILTDLKYINLQLRMILIHILSLYFHGPALMYVVIV